MNIEVRVSKGMVRLSDEQRAIVCYNGEHHLLVVAAPGSGKTHTLTERIAHLVAHKAVEPRQVLAMTFTRQAADELRSRLYEHPKLQGRAQGIAANTFHAVCGRWLREYGRAIDIAPEFVVVENEAQRRALRRAIARAGIEVPVRREQRILRDIGNAISARKRRLRPPTNQPDMTGWGTANETPSWVQSVEPHYRDLLRERNALDYDDVIVETLRLLETEHEAVEEIQRRFTHLFIDEYHDVSGEQYALMELLAPPQSPLHRVMVLADPQQSIYGWRYADAKQMLKRLHRAYLPRLFKLSHNYRSTGHIVRAAEAVINAGGAKVRVSLEHDPGQTVYEKCSEDERAEARWIVQQIARMHGSGYAHYDDIAILYAINERSRTLESALLLDGVPVERIEDGRFFADPDVQGTLRYLALVASLHDHGLESALNWPRVLVDEPTMIRMERIADAHGLTLGELARTIDRFHDEIGPLTRHRVQDFVRTLERELLPIADESVTTVVERLLALINTRQDVWEPDEREDMVGFLDFLGRPLAAAVDMLAAALAAARSIMLVHDGSLDAVCGCVILEHLLATYWNVIPTIRSSTTDADDACTITLGCHHPASSHGFGLAVRDARTLQYSISTQAWRVGQLLLMRAERAHDETFVAYDLETSSLHHTTAELLELAAQRISNGSADAPMLTTLVRPQRPIPPEATDVHGIRDRDVMDAPPPADVLRQFIDYVGDTPLLGHNIAAFDQRLLVRIAADEGMVLPQRSLLDTCQVARRLFPYVRHGLGELAERWKVPVRESHRAAADVNTTLGVWRVLRERLWQEQELDALAEALPAVAIGIIAAGLPVEGENEALVLAGSRADGSPDARRIMRRIADLIGDSGCVARARRAAVEHPRPSAEQDERWERLADLWQTQLTHYRATASDQSLAAFLRYAMLAQPIDETPTADRRVSMMTIYGSKGKEWPVVFVVGLEDGTLPFATSDLDERAQARRLMYVAMTRAKRRAILTWVKRRDGRTKRYSPFFDAIPDEHLRTLRSPLRLPKR